MKLKEAMDIIESKKPVGYVVCFEWKEGRILGSDYFPDVRRSKEEPIKTEQEAWELAKKFAEATKGKCVNIYVSTFSDGSLKPVDDYMEKKIENR